MSDQRALITCRHVWSDEEEIRAYLIAHGVEADFPRFEGQQLGEEDLLPVLHHYDGLLAGDDHITASVMESAPKLRVISKWGIGVDSIDLAAANALAITVLNTPGVFGDELADYAMGFVHMLARRQHEVDTKVKAGIWHQIRGVSLRERTLGIIGLGSSGRALARRAVAASMRVIGCDVGPVQPVDGCELVALERLLGESDIISLHVPATPETRRMINHDSIARMKWGVWLVNTSRGSLVDESALAVALSDGRIGAAALDVFEVEPLPVDSPLVSMQNVILGAHNGSNTDEAVKRTTWAAVENLLRGLGTKG